MKNVLYCISIIFLISSVALIIYSIVENNSRCFAVGFCFAMLGGLTIIFNDWLHKAMTYDKNKDYNGWKEYPTDNI